jgi:choline transport protein
MWSVVPNAALGFLLAVTLIFTLGDINSILATPTGQPFIQVFFNGTQSYAATNAMTAVVIILLTSCCVSEVATSSRQIWSFARDRGLPFSGWLSQVSPGWNIPLHAVCVSLVVSSLLACINLGSSTTLNAINSLGGVSILTSYFITISCLIWRRVAGPPLPPRRWSLGRFGLAINIVSLLFLVPVWFFAFWPLATPVTPQNMNWSSTMFGGTISFALVYYAVRARHQYVGPVLYVKRDD